MASDITLESAMKAFFEHQMRSVYHFSNLQTMYQISMNLFYF